MNKTSLHLAMLFTATLLLAACSPARTGLSGSTLGMNTNPGIAVSVSPTCIPTENGRLWASATTDDLVNSPLISFSYVFYRDADRPEAVLYTAIATLQDVGTWNFVPQPSRIPHTFGPVTRIADASLFGTVRNLCIPADSDWASLTMAEQGKNMPKEWLARRWVYSLDESTRAMAEYREPKPDWLETGSKGILLISEKNSDYLREFEKRANAAFSFAKTHTGSNEGLPSMNGPIPDVADLAGEIIKVSRSDDSGLN